VSRWIYETPMRHLLPLLLVSSAFAAEPLAFAPPRVVQSGGKKFDTPAWVASEKCLLFTDLEAGKLFRADGDKITDALADGGRGKVGPDGKWYGVVKGELATWVPGEKPKVLAAKASGDKAWAVNDLAVGPKGRVYVTTLKDPDKGRVSVVEPDGKVSVVWDGADEPTLTNPNGVAVSPDGKHLFVGISSYADRKQSGIYRFPLSDDGTPDVKTGKAKAWGAVNAPDGVAVGPDGRVYATAAAQVVILDADGKKAGALKIPKGSGTNLAFGGADGRTLFVTTNETVYAFDPK
jgi:sugar lactone lactonase YvrE